MPDKIEGKYRIGCRIFAIRVADIVAYMFFRTPVGASISNLDQGFREHWVLLADLCLRLAEHTNTLGSTDNLPHTPNIQRQKIREVRRLLRPLRNAAESNIKHTQGEHAVGWIE